MATDVIDQSGEEPGLPRRRRKRRTPKPDPAATSWLSVVRTPLFGRAVFLAMTLLALALTWRQYHQVDASVGRLGPLQLGMSAQEAQRLLGQGKTIPGQPGQLRFSDEGRTFGIVTDPASARIIAIACTETDLTARPCPAQLGIRVGDGRDRVVSLLGIGDASAGRTEDMWYPAIATSFRLNEDKVAEIRVAAAGSGGSIWPIVFWRLLL